MLEARNGVRNEMKMAVDAIKIFSLLGRVTTTRMLGDADALQRSVSDAGVFHNRQDEVVRIGGDA